MVNKHLEYIEIKLSKGRVKIPYSLEKMINIDCSGMVGVFDVTNINRNLRIVFDDGLKINFLDKNIILVILNSHGYTKIFVPTNTDCTKKHHIVLLDKFWSHSIDFVDINDYVEVWDGLVSTFCLKFRNKMLYDIG